MFYEKLILIISLIFLALIFNFHFNYTDIWTKTTSLLYICSCFEHENRDTLIIRLTDRERGHGTRSTYQF